MPEPPGRAIAKNRITTGTLADSAARCVNQGGFLWVVACPERAEAVTPCVPGAAQQTAVTAKRKSRVPDAVQRAALRSAAPQIGDRQGHRILERPGVCSARSARVVLRPGNANTVGDPLSASRGCGQIAAGLMSQRVLITAGAAGIGREFARAFMANGAKVFVCDIDDNALAAIAKEIPGLTARRCDMSSRAEIERMVPEAVAALGGLDVLINNAGIAGLTLPIAEYPPDDWDKVVAVNLTAMFDVSRLAIPHLKKSKAGCIINMSSIAGRYGFPNRSPYAATKWGAIGLTKTLAMELGEWGIRANAIAPGAVEGDRIVRVFQGRAQISGRSMEEVKADAFAAQSIDGFIDPKDIAQLAVFLASDAAKSISGQVIPIDKDRQKA
jgi:NAD(P)-dependent dehydrogenase (short-subunit alcohol dehydrogenase family)